MWDIIYNPSEKTLKNRCVNCKAAFDLSNPDYEANYCEDSYVINVEGKFACNKLCAKAYEKKLIKEGKMKPIEGQGFAIFVDDRLRDMSGEKVWFPKDGRPYYDKALKKTFTSKKEKCGYLKEKRLVMDGSSQTKWPLESGALRDRSYRKQMRMED